MSRKKASVYAKTLGQTTVFNAGATHHKGRRFMLTFTEVAGSKAMEGREAQVVMDPRELSGVLMAIPAGDMPDEVVVAVTQMALFLNRYAVGEEGSR
jgi:hypothetical protein